MSEPFRIRDDDLRLAHTLTRRLGTSLDKTVSRAVRNLVSDTPIPGAVGVAQQAELEALRTLAAEARAHIVPGASNDHGWHHDWKGLPA